MSESSTLLLSVAQFNRIYMQYRSRLTAIAYSYVRDTGAADDLVNDSFLTLWENRENIESSMEAYLYGILRNKCLLWIRGNQRKQQIHKSIYDTQYRLAEYYLNTIESCDPTHMFVEEIDTIFTSELEKMPEMTRKIFQTHNGDKKTYRQIAALYGISERKVKREMLRAYEMLRHSLVDYLPVILLFFWIE